MNRRPPIRLLLTALALGSVLLPQTASACAACFGKSDAKMAQGMNMGIFSLLAVVVFMQVAVGSFFFIFLRKRAARIAAEQTARASAAHDISPSNQPVLP